jgi:hypothetical protein
MRKTPVLTTAALVLAGALPAAAHAAAATVTDPPGCNPTAAHPCHVIKPVSKPAPSRVDNCGYRIDIAILTNSEVDESWTYSDGASVDHVTGSLVLRFTNHDDPQRSVDRDVSGATTSTHDPGGTVETFTATGDNWFGFGPNGQRNTGEPGLVVTHGFVFAQAVPPTAQKFALASDGSQENLCALLQSPAN